MADEINFRDYLIEHGFNPDDFKMNDDQIEAAMLECLADGTMTVVGVTPEGDAQFKLTEKGLARGAELIKTQALGKKIADMLRPFSAEGRLRIINSVQEIFSHDRPEVKQ